MNFSKKRELNAGEQIAEQARSELPNFATRPYSASNGFSTDSGNSEEHFLIDMIGEITGRLKQKYDYSDEDIFMLCNAELLVPVAIFAGKLGPAEALAKFLKENHGLSYNEISELIGRDKRSVWANYKRAVKKMPWHFEINASIAVPVSIFKSEKSILETLVNYLKDEKKMRSSKIAQLLNKNLASIWAANNRAKKKTDNGKNEGH